jgi:hypothetical protein
MSPERGLEVTRAIREKIAREHGNDPRRLVEYYLGYQERFAERLRRAPSPGPTSGEAAEHPGTAAARDARR